MLPLVNTGIVSRFGYSVVYIPYLRYEDVYKAANDTGVVVVGAGSYSVGAAGGWVLGGGHSSLSPQYGLGVDSIFIPFIPGMFF